MKILYYIVQNFAIIPYMTQRRLILTAVLLKGFSSVVAQTLLLRELFIVFYGNELTFGIILSVWLISGALGSGLISGFFKNAKSPLGPFCFFQVILASWLPCALIFIRTSRIWLGVPFGEVLNIGAIASIVLLSLALIALSDGAMFTLSFRLVPSVAKIYFFECLGVIAGGFTFTFILLNHFNSFQTALLLSCLNLFCASLLLLKEKNHVPKIAVGFLLLVFLNLFSRAPVLQKETLAAQWQKKNIISSKNSAYGNITVSKESNQYTIFYDGLPVVSVPTPDSFFTEDFVHIPMLAKPGAEKVLFIGTAAGGLLAETLKYPVSKIVYAEMDPLFIKTLKGLPEPSAQKELNDPRVVVVGEDGRKFVKRTSEKFDRIFVNVGLPTSLVLNRYYTREFFSDVKKRLTPGGIAVFKTWGSLAYLSDELKKLNASLLVTLESEFEFIRIVPGDGFNLFLASRAPLGFESSKMGKDWKELKLKTSVINPSYLELRLQKQYLEWFTANLAGEIKNASINQDLRPTGLYDGLGLYYSQFSKKIPKLFSGFKKVNAPAVAFSVVLSLLVLRGLIRRGKMNEAALNFTILSTGFFAMSIQIMVLFLFQSLLGYLFQWLAILTASFMAGASAGAFYSHKNRRFLRSTKKLGTIEIVFACLTTCLLLGIVALCRTRMGASPHIKWLFSLISISAGALVGLELPLIFNLSGRTIKMPARIAGLLYSLDLLGACCGALLVPLILIPSCGIVSTCLILCVLKAGNGANLLLLNPEREQTGAAYR